jgi:hypothetical protein
MVSSPFMNFLTIPMDSCEVACLKPLDCLAMSAKLKSDPKILTSRSSRPVEETNHA